MCLRLPCTLRRSRSLFYCAFGFTFSRILVIVYRIYLDFSFNNNFLSKNFRLFNEFCLNSAGLLRNQFGYYFDFVSKRCYKMVDIIWCSWWTFRWPLHELVLESGSRVPTNRLKQKSILIALLHGTIEILTKNKQIIS